MKLSELYPALVTANQHVEDQYPGLTPTFWHHRQREVKRLTEGYLLASFRACWNHVLAVGIIECHRRARIAEGLSIGIERCVLRDLQWAFNSRNCGGGGVFEYIGSLPR